jgi:hypothetical protein
MRTPEELEAVAVEAYGPYAAVAVAEVRALADGIRAARRRLHTLAERSDCGRTVRYAQRTLARDALGVDGGAARDALGAPIRPLAWVEHALCGAGGERAAVTPAELRALVAEWRRLRRALAMVGERSRCDRSRAYAERALGALSCSRHAPAATVRRLAHA